MYTGWNIFLPPPVSALFSTGSQKVGVNLTSPRSHVSSNLQPFVSFFTLFKIGGYLPPWPPSPVVSWSITQTNPIPAPSENGEIVSKSPQITTFLNFPDAIQEKTFGIKFIDTDNSLSDLSSSWSWQEREENTWYQKPGR